MSAVSCGLVVMGGVVTGVVPSRGMDTLPLFDLDQMTEPDSEPVPRCAMCPRPLRWNPRRQEYHPYCGGQSCTNRIRICRECGQEYSRDTHGAGTKYCSPACSSVRTEYVPRRKRGVACVMCGAVGSTPHRGRYDYICASCTEPIKHVLQRLRNHHVSTERIKQLIADPTCEGCGCDVVTPVRNRGSGKPRAPLVVDHDHTCCPTPTSCGRCVRGLLCDSCNSAIGFAGNSPDVLTRLAAYLMR